MNFEIYELTIFRFSLIIFKYFKVISIFITICSLFLLGTGLLYKDIQLINFTVQCFAVFIIGVVFSSYIHEYMHIFGFRKAGVKQIEIQTTIYRFSLKANTVQLKDSEKFLVAFIGPISCFAIGCILYCLSLLVIDKPIIKCLSYIYMYHIVNVLPIFGDGKIIFKVLIKKFERKKDKKK